MRRPAFVAVLALLALAPGVGARGGAEIDGVRAKALAVQLAALGPRVAGSEAERRGQELVAARLRALGYRVVLQPFPLPRGGSSRNVVAVPDGPPRALVVAHVDSVREGRGANDNASGVAVLLELARALRDRAGVMLVATGAEERRETGSRMHLGARRLLRGLSARGRASIRLAVALDMVGVGARLHVRGLEAAPNASAHLLLRYTPAASYLRDPGWSDHAELTRAGIPAAWLEWRDDACYHAACDTAGRLRPARLQAAGEAALRALRAVLVER